MIKKIYLDPYIFIGISLLAMVGVLILFSASEGDTTIVFKQSIYVVLGLILFLFVSQPDPDIYRRFSPLILFGTLVLVFIAYFFGPEINGARRWIRLFGFSFQPSELLKISLPLFLASFLFDKKLPINAKQTAISIFFICLYSTRSWDGIADCCIWIFSTISSWLKLGFHWNYNCSNFNFLTLHME
jgi:rod shape determining protein RodA